MKKRFLNIFCVVALCLTLLPATALAAEPVYLALGDSITTGYAPTSVNQNGKVDNPFADQVATEQGYALNNQAANGETSASLLVKLQDDTIDVSNAVLITITIGGNDLMNALYDFLVDTYNAANPTNTITLPQLTAALQDLSSSENQALLMGVIGYLGGFGGSKSETDALDELESNLTAIIDKVQSEASTATIVITNQYNPYSHIDNIAAASIVTAFENGVTNLNERITKVALEKGVIVADVYTPFKDAADNPCNAYVNSILPSVDLSLDFHPNQAGHNLIAAAINEALQPQSTYAATVEDADHGSVRSNTAQAVAGFIVTLTVIPDEGYELDTLTVTDASGNTVALADQGDGKYTFTMPASAVTVEATFAETAPEHLLFADVAEGAWYADAVRYVYENGLMAGYDDGTFGPEDDLSRAQLCQILYNAVGQPSISGGSAFTDVDGGAWYSDAVAWASAQGVVGGYGNGTFGPQDNITREQLAVMLYRFAQAQGYDVSVGEDTNILSYTDVADVAEYAAPAMQWACGAGIINGTGDGSTLTPQGQATRAQIATMLMRFCETLQSA